MAATRSLALPLAALLVALLAALLVPAAAAPRVRRQLADDAALQPLDDAADDEQTREKRKLEGVTQAKFGIKNAVLGFVFGKINSLIDAKTRFVDTLDRQNIELNKQYGIEPPAPGGLASLSGVVSQSGITWRRPVGTHNRLGRSRRATAQDDDIPTFDRNKVSLDFPGSLFGPSVSLLIRTTKIVGDVIQNSAVRYQSFLRLFRPLFRGPFEIKGLDPPPPTTTTTTSTTAAPPAITSPATMPEVPDIPGDQPADNEVRRRRRHFQQ